MYRQRGKEKNVYEDSIVLKEQNKRWETSCNNEDNTINGWTKTTSLKIFATNTYLVPTTIEPHLQLRLLWNFWFLLVSLSSLLYIHYKPETNKKEQNVSFSSLIIELDWLIMIWVFCLTFVFTTNILDRSSCSSWLIPSPGKPNVQKQSKTNRISIYLLCLVVCDNSYCFVCLCFSIVSTAWQ